MRGRKPQPTALRVLRGNPGQRRLNEHEPTHPTFDPLDVPPELVDARARGEWQRIAPQLAATRQVTIVDRATLLAYCLKYGEWLALQDDAKRHPFIVKGSLGNPIPNPALRLANQTLDLMIKTASELGITPASRSRVSASAPAPPVSKWAGVLSS